MWKLRIYFYILLMKNSSKKDEDIPINLVQIFHNAN